MKTYTYQGVEYKSESQLRKAIWLKGRIALPKLKTVEEWAKYGVTLTITETPEPTLEQLQSKKLSQLELQFNRYRESSDTFLVSSLGFKANANVTAFDNVSGLVAQLQHRAENGEESPEVGVMTFDDELVMMDLGKMKTLQVEISQNGSNIYAQKWALRQAIQAAEDKEALDAIVIVFTHTDFSEAE